MNALDIPVLGVFDNDTYGFLLAHGCHASATCPLGSDTALFDHFIFFLFLSLMRTSLWKQSSHEIHLGATMARTGEFRDWASSEWLLLSRIRARSFMGRLLLCKCEVFEHQMFLCLLLLGFGQDSSLLLCSVSCCSQSDTCVKII